MLSKMLSAGLFAKVRGPTVAKHQRSKVVTEYVLLATKRKCVAKPVVAPLASYYKEKVSTSQIALQRSNEDRNLSSPFMKWNSP